uniref:Uncharacterized protein n=1 Tax=Anguilla anguilla TaxID=7936 RepID=A0A0E9UQI9_ANGAN
MPHPHERIVIFRKLQNSA